MTAIAKDLWGAALHRLRLVLLGSLSTDRDGDLVLERSRERVQAARDALDRAAQASRRRPSRRTGK